jgi:hypothetical protein
LSSDASSDPVPAEVPDAESRCYCFTDMFRSARRPVVYPQAEHARLAATIAAAWGNDEVERPRLPFESFVRGVAVHDRGYGNLDADGIGEVSPERWIDLQRRSFEPRHEDPVVDLVVAMHACRLVSWSRSPAAATALAEMDAALPAIREAAGVDEPDALEADRVTDLCDRISFDLCVEAPASGSVGSFSYELDGEGIVTLDPWPLGVPRLPGVLVGFEADGYPDALRPVASRFELKPA